MDDARQASPIQAAAPLNFFERYLSLWVLLCMVLGTLSGLLAPATAQAIGALQVAQVNLPVALLIWLMIIPMLMKIDLHSLPELYQHRAGMAVTLAMNWLIKPFSMALLAWLCIRYLFAAWLPAEHLDSYVAGLILLGAAPCTAMVFVWSNLCHGNANFTISQVAINDLLMVFAFAPIVALLLGVSAISVPWATLLLSVLLYIVVPLMLAQWLRARLLSQGAAALAAVLRRLNPLSMAALLATLLLLFAFQGQQLIAQPLVIAILAVPILLQTLLIAALGYGLCRQLRVRHDIAGPAALIGASNFFELAVAVAIALYGFNSGAALATVVGVLIEVPVMLWLVGRINRSKAWYEAPLSSSA